MRKFYIISIMLLGVSLAGEGLAAPCYGTKLPQAKEFFLGYQNHSIFKRYLEGDFGKMRSTQHFLLLSYGLTEWLSIDLKGGAGFIKQRPLTSSELDYPSSFGGGYGFRIKFYEDEEAEAKAVFGFQHISVHPRSIRIEGVKNAAVLDDWQVSLLLSKSVFKVDPYLGVKLSRVDYIHWVDDERERRMSDLTKSVGAVLGLDIPLTDQTWLNLEAHFIDEEAFSISCLFKF